MIRLALFAACLAAAGYSLAYSFFHASDQEAADVNQVSRATPDFLTLQPALAPMAPPAAAITPQDEGTHSAIAQPRPAPAVSANKPPEPVQDDVARALYQMNLGILNELQKPVPQAERAAATPTPRPVAAASETQNAQLYTVQDGDSLAGISFRHYGNTVGYITILEANADQLRSPADIRTGMVLRIPRTP